MVMRITAWILLWCSIRYKFCVHSELKLFWPCHQFKVRSSTELMPHLTLDIDQLSLPDKVYISVADFKSKRFTFSWSPVTTDCSMLHYKIIASNCGSCPTNTTLTNVTCTGVPTDSSVCTFTIHTVVCGNITGVTSDKVKSDIGQYSTHVYLLRYT